MSSHDFPQRKSFLALLTLTGGLAAALPALTVPAFAQTVPQGAPNARSTKAIVPCITNPKTKNTIQPCFTNPKTRKTAEPCIANPKNKNSIQPCITNPKSKGMTATSMATSQSPKNGNWDMNNLKQAPADPSKAKTRQ